MSVELTGLSHTIWKERYSHETENNWSDTVRRVSNFVAQAEPEGDKEKWANEFFNSIENMDFVPAGRILANSGRPKAALLNCYVLPIKDSRESIGEALKNYLIISGTGGGVGLSFRDIRYKGAPIVTAGGFSSGSVSFMDVINAVADTVKIGGGRRAATMLSLPIDHPDILDFLSHKLDHGKLNNANISVEINSDFIKNVRRSKDWNLMWAGKKIAETSAKDLWITLVENASKSGEPGMLNFELAEHMSNSWYFNRLSCTNPCGEIFLPEYGVCCLGSLNVVNFLKDGVIDEKAFKASAKVAVRFLDNVLTVNTYPLPQSKESAHNERRIGLGLMGIHTAMIKLGIKYSSRKSLEFIENLYEMLRDASYIASSDLAEEKGPFPMFNAEKYLDSGFCKTLPGVIRRRINKKGMRNVCVNSQPPVGTTALLPNVSSGIEPIYAPIMQRTFFSDVVGDGERKSELVLDSSIANIVTEETTVEDLAHVEGALDIPVLSHFQAQEAAQRFVDNAVSKTLNVPKNFKNDELSGIMLEFASKLKGTTVYKEGSREHEPLKAMPVTAKNLKLAKQNSNVSKSNECPSGKCEI